jgi:hypothetical protein
LNNDPDFESKLKEVLKRAVMDARKRQDRHPIPAALPIPIKTRRSPLNYFLRLVVIMLVSMLTISYTPSHQRNHTAKTPVYYPIDSSRIEITVKAASADDIPKIRIGPGCSFFRSQKRKPIIV